MSRYLHQLVFCSDRKGRVYRREITVTGSDAMVTNVETLPPHYDIAMERLRDDGEEVARFDGRLKYWRGYQGCPFCGNQGSFICLCGFISCLNVEKRPVHTCPRCSGIFDVFDADYTPMSESGFVHGERRTELPRGNARQELPRRPKPPDRPLLGAPDAKKESEREKLRKYLEQQRLRLEDKRDK